MKNVSLVLFDPLSIINWTVKLS